MSDDPRREAPSVARNRAVILDALRPILPPQGLLLEVASGTGEHCAYLAASLPALRFQPTEPEPDGRASIDAWCAGLPNVRPALALDASAEDWPVVCADAGRGGTGGGGAGGGIGQADCGRDFAAVAVPSGSADRSGDGVGA